ncbi:divergent CRAL/TRIO domain-containing protein [Scheffersomyces coipomensis]|uniref:divergent CRAL/TRIO domain-containing protein n=1 Tax=Scheffersomyces coipomensis TaxID=1788519 RepID=UPI00315D315B
MERIFYKSDVTDIPTNLPVYTFDTSYLPSTEIIDYDEFIPTLMSFVPQHPYVLIMFNCGLNKISWIWGIKFLKSFLADNNNLHNLHKLITVHDSWFIKSMTQILSTTKGNFLTLNLLFDYFTMESPSISSDSSNNIMIHCNSLSDLSHYIDITKLKISLNIWKHNLQIEHSIQLSKRFIPLLNPLTTFNIHSNPTFHHHFYQIFNIINSYSDKVELIFHKPGNKINTDVLFDCINRNQLIWINDWDLYCIATTFKRILMELPSPLIPTNSIPLPIKDDYNYTFETFHNLLQQHGSNELTQSFKLVLIQLFELGHHLIHTNKITNHTSLSLSKSLSHCLSHELISSQNKDHILIINRFLKNVFDNWSRLRLTYVNDPGYLTVHESIFGKTIIENNHHQNNNTLPDDSYDLSYDITIEDTVGSTDDNEFRVSVNTSNILTFNSKLSKSTSNNTTNNNNNNNGSSSNRELLSTIRDLNFSQNKLLSSTTTTSLTSKVSKALNDVSNIALQYPPQKYNFIDSSPQKKSRNISPIETIPPPNNVKRPVIRGRKVGQLAKLFEERAHGLELLKGL